jgi:hypothetical protein
LAHEGRSQSSHSRKWSGYETAQSNGVHATWPYAWFDHIIAGWFRKDRMDGAKFSARCIRRSHMGIIKGSRIGIILAALSFLIYVCTVFSLPQQSDNPFNVERTSLAAAVSNIVYRARLGRLYSGALEGFFATIERPLRQVFDEWPPDRQRGNLVGVSTDGNGVGYVLAATMAMRLFGLHAVSLPLFTAALMGLSALMLLWRFHGDFAGLVVLYFCSLTVLLFTMVVWDPAYAEQIAVGGIRYFSLVAILPAFHLLFDLLDPPAGETGATQ